MWKNNYMLRIDCVVDSSRRILLRLLLILFALIFIRRKETIYRINHKLLILFSIFLMLNTVDTVTTYIGLTSRKATEINPLHENLNSEGIPMQFVLIKNVVLPSILYILIHTCLKRVKGNHKIPYYTILLAIIIYYCFVVGNNLMVLG